MTDQPSSPDRDDVAVEAMRAKFADAARRLGHPQWDADEIATAMADVRDTEVDRLRAQLASRVQCNDCGAVGTLFTGDDGRAYLDPSGQIGH